MPHGKSVNRMFWSHDQHAITYKLQNNLAL